MSLTEASWTGVAIIAGLDLLVCLVCLLGFLYIILPYLLQNEKGGTIRAAICRWRFEPDMMTEGTTQQQRLAAQLYTEFIDLLLKITGLMLLGSAALTPVNYYFGDKAGNFFQRSSTLSISDDKLWAHACYCWLLSLGCILLVERITDPREIEDALSPALGGDIIPGGVNIAYELSTVFALAKRVKQALAYCQLLYSGLGLIVWNHLAVGKVRRVSQNCCFSAFLLAIVLLVFSGTATLETLEKGVDALHLPGRLSLALSLVTFLCAWLLVPLLLEALANLTPFSRHDAYSIWYLNRYFVYLMVAIVFVTTTALSAAALLREWFTTRDTDSTFTSVFSAKYTVYFIKYSINFALLSSPLELLQYTELLAAQCESCLACCSRWCNSKFAEKHNLYGTGIPQVVLHIFAIGLLYSAILPIIPPFTMIFLVMKRKMDSFNLLLQPPIPIEEQSGLYMGPPTVALQALNWLVAVLGLYQIGMLSYFTTHSCTYMSAVTIVIFWFTTGIYFVATGCAHGCTQIALLNQFVLRVKRLVEDSAPVSSIEDVLTISPDEYMHPALETYLGPGRTLRQALDIASFSAKPDEQAEHEGLIGHPAFAAGQSQWSPVQDYDDHEDGDWSPMGRHMMHPTASSMGTSDGIELDNKPNIIVEQLQTPTDTEHSEL